MSNRQYTMSKDAHKQRIKFGFQKNMNYSGEWTMVRMRVETRKALKDKFGSLNSAFEFALKAR